MGQLGSTYWKTSNKKHREVIQAWHFQYSQIALSRNHVYETFLLHETTSFWRPKLKSCNSATTIKQALIWQTERSSLASLMFQQPALKCVICIHQNQNINRCNYINWIYIIEKTETERASPWIGHVHPIRFPRALEVPSSPEFPKHPSWEQCAAPCKISIAGLSVTQERKKGLWIILGIWYVYIYNYIYIVSMLHHTCS